jgi:hypothetical protein
MNIERIPNAECALIQLRLPKVLGYGERNELEI